MKTRTTRPSRTLSLARVSTLAAVATASGAHAAIIFHNTSIPPSDDSTPGNTFWDVDGTGGDDVILSNAPFVKDLFSTGSAGFRPVVQSSKLLGLALGEQINSLKSFAGGSSVSVLSVFRSGSLLNASNITSGVSTYIGYQFNPSGTVLYGWANVTLTDGGTHGTFTVNSWAYDDSGAAILAGDTGAAIPEPADYAVGLGALALGAAGLRRRRQARAGAA